MHVYDGPAPLQCRLFATIRGISVLLIAAIKNIVNNICPFAANIAYKNHIFAKKSICYRC